MNYWNRILCLVLFLVSGFQQTIADSGGFTTVRYAKTRGRVPVEIEYDDTWATGDGYRPIRIRIKPVGAAKFTKDRQLTFRLRKHAIQNHLSSDKTIKTVDLPEGATQVELLFLYQSARRQSWVEMDVWEDRETRRNVLATQMGMIQPNSLGISEGTPVMMIIDSDVPILEDRASRIGRFRGKNEASIPNPSGYVWSIQSYMTNMRTTDRDFGESWVDIVEKIPSIGFSNPDDLPEDWLAFSCLDIVYLSLDDLVKLQEQSPTRWQAIDRWVRAGGNLWLADVGQDFAKLTEVEKRCGLSVSDVEKKLGSAGSLWTLPTKSTFGSKIPEFGREERRWVNGQYVKDDQIGDAPKFEDFQDQQIGFAFRELQLGTISVFQDEYPLAKKDNWYWRWVFESLGTERWLWSMRHGFSPSRFNDGFWEHLIPGVGLAPVNSFRVIISLFALAIGPLNYYWLSRRKRLSWMLFTVPSAALIVTIALVGYALLTDGFSAKSRIRSLMDLDQGAGKATTWARQTYYSGVAPADGLKFDSATIVFPVDHDAARRTYQGGQERECNWDDQQHLANGYLPSRTTSQFLTIQSSNTPLQLKITRDDSGRIIGAKNLLGSQIQLLILRDHDGSFHTATRCGNDMETDIHPADRVELSAALQSMGPTSLSVPLGVDLGLLTRGQSRWRWHYDRNVSDPVSDSSRMEKVMDQAFTRWQMMAPGTFVALMKDNRELEIGVRSKIRDHEFHAIRGHF